MKKYYKLCNSGYSGQLENQTEFSFRFDLIQFKFGSVRFFVLTELTEPHPITEPMNTPSNDNKFFIKTFSQNDVSCNIWINFIIFHFLDGQWFTNHHDTSPCDKTSFLKPELTWPVEPWTGRMTRSRFWTKIRLNRVLMAWSGQLKPQFSKH
jgi:hypothetical protein